MFASIGFVACEDENRQDMTPEIGEGEATPKITMYTPTAGGKSTSLTLYGTHFGTDLDNIRVTVTGVDAEGHGIFDNGADIRFLAQRLWPHRTALGCV